ncbi:MAG: hypothetical protein AB7S26_27250 [Sandaracinaceae bacterium]
MILAPRRALVLALGLAVGLIALLAAIVIDAGARRSATRRRTAREVVQLTGLPDLALSSSSRWLRHPSESEAGAFGADVPAGLDTDPAGALIGPPRAILRVGGVEVRRHR